MKFACPAALIDQSFPPVMAKVVEALLFPIVITSAAVELVAIFIVSVPELVTPPISIALVEAVSPIFIAPVPETKVMAEFAVAFPSVRAPVEVVSKIVFPWAIT